MIEDTLRHIGLTQGEARVYLALIELGSSTSGEITKRCKISGSKVYEVLDRLIDKGLVAHTTINGVKHFESAGPHKILDFIDKKEESIKVEKQEVLALMPQLLLKQQESPKSEAKIFLGFEGIKTVNDDIIDSLKRGQEWLSMGLSEQPKSWEAYFSRRQSDRAKKGIIHKHLINKKYMSLYTSRKSLSHTEFRFLPKSLEMPTSTEIYGDKVAIMLLVPQNPLAILIESPEVAHSFRKYFQLMWGMATKPKSK